MTSQFQFIATTLRTKLGMLLHKIICHNVHFLAKRYSFLFFNDISHGEIKAHLKSITRYYMIEIMGQDRQLDRLVKLWESTISNIKIKKVFEPMVDECIKRSSSRNVWTINKITLSLFKTKRKIFKQNLVEKSCLTYFSSTGKCRINN